MTWTLFVGAILAFLRPVLYQWLENVLRAAEEKLSAADSRESVMSDQQRVRAVFREARAELGWRLFHPFRHRALDACETATFARSVELGAAAVGDEPVPQMGTVEADDLAKLF